MGGKMSRNKGAGGEREAREILLEALAPVYRANAHPLPDIQRNLMQSRAGGFDLVGLSWLALEVKRQETLALPAWWRQTVAQAKEGQVPFLMYRPNRTPWRCRAWIRTFHGAPGAPCGTHRVVADMDLDNGMQWLQHEAHWQLQSLKPKEDE